MSDIREVYPYLRVSDAKAAIDFYARAFGAKELLRLLGGHIEDVSSEEMQRRYTALFEK
jgi:uncharacterized glyoxalase superfamily protein PhnB